MSAEGVLRFVEGDTKMFWCPGCKGIHTVGPGWVYTGTPQAPTFRPSILVRGGHYASQWKEGDEGWCTFYPKHGPDAKHKFTCGICHSFVTDGQIQFLADCTHELAGQTVPLQAVPE